MQRHFCKVFLTSFIIISCGGSGPRGEPLPLFDDVQKGDLTIASQATLSNISLIDDLAMNASFNAGDPVITSQSKAASLEISDTALLMGLSLSKEINESNETRVCSNVDDLNVRCEENVPGKEGGFLKFGILTSLKHPDEATEIGAIQFSFNFDDYKFPGYCNDSINVRGTINCLLNVDARKLAEHIPFKFDGYCQTDESHINVTMDDREYSIEYDLSLSLDSLDKYC